MTHDTPPDARGAFAAWEARLARDPLDGEALDGYWRAATDAGRHTEALARLDRALALEPGFPPLHFMRAVSLQGLARFDEAHGALREALRLRFRDEARREAPPPPGPRVPAPGVTLACADCRNHELAVFALRRSMAQCRFERAVLFTNRELDLPDIEVRVIPDIASIADYSRFMVKALAQHIETPHALVVQYDGYVVNGGAWEAAFLDWDYVGAPWGEAGGGRTVGNGGFSLRSRKLLRALADPRIAQLVPEDVAICRTYRRLLEDEHGIRFAPPDLAARFAFESLPPSGPTLGFHGIAHMARIVDMTPAELAAYRPEGMRLLRKG